MGTKYDWNLWTAPQTYLDGSSRPYDMGRGVGGGSLINGMCCEFLVERFWRFGENGLLCGLRDAKYLEYWLIYGPRDERWLGRL